MFTRGTNHRRRALLALATSLVMPLALVSFGTPAHAAVPDAPGGLTPDLTNVGTIPTLQWTPVPGAASYDVTVSANADFSSPLVAAVNTVQPQYVPTVQLPAGDVYWEVRAKNTDGASDWAAAQFTRDPVSLPTQVGPADGTTLPQPDNPVSLSWNAVPGATGYTVQIGTDQTFADPALYSSYPSKTTSFLLSTLQGVGTYYWRVQATLSSTVVSDWTGAWSYAIPSKSTADGSLPSEPLHPNDDADEAVQDVDLDWAPIAGATTYDLQVSTDINFLNSSALVLTQTGITGTRYTRPRTLNNDQYYWRVRPVDAAGHATDWGSVPVWKFRRNWPDQPTLEYPADGATVGDPFSYQWTPVHHASSYTVQMSTTSSFSSGVKSCVTVNTTLVPAQDEPAGLACMPNAAGSYYWRVLATDGNDASPSGPVTEDVNATIHTFTYNPDLVPLTSPSDGAHVTVPTLRWDPVSGAATYVVTITPLAGGSVVTKETAATSFTPQAALTPGSTYRWQVQTKSGDKRLGAGILAGSQPTFTVDAAPTPTALSPEPTGSGGTYDRFPTLTWTPVVDATRYNLLIRKKGSTGGWTSIVGDFEYPAGEELTDAHLAPDTYQWIAQAYNGTSLLDTTHAPGEFTITANPAISGYRAAAVGTELHDNAANDVAGKTCNATLPANCSNLRNTPVLRWAPVRNAGVYRLYLGKDQNLTNPLITGTPYIDVYTNEWTPTLALADSNAASATFWHVLACPTANTCPAKVAAQHSFNQKSNAVKLTSPANVADPSVADDVTLRWEDYLDTSTNAAQGDSAISTPGRTEAAYYHVQVSTEPTFTTPSAILDNIYVDQPFYTSFANTYPEGTIYWRVQAFDGSDNPLSWSDVWTFHKHSPTVAPTSAVDDPFFPRQGVTFQSGDVFHWNALPYAKAYNVGVYKTVSGVTPDCNSSTNKVSTASGTTQQVAFAPGTPLAPGSYQWMVQRTDAKNRKGACSAPIGFTVVGQGVSQTAPDANATFHTGDPLLFQWDAVTGATKYRWQYRVPGSTSVKAYKDTPALAWAPTTAIQAASWDWQVVAYDSGNQVIGSSAWRRFTIQAPPLPMTSGPKITGTARYGLTLTANPGTWPASTSFAYQWMRDGRALTGATRSSYKVAAPDVAHHLSVKVTASKSGYATGVATSPSVTASRAISKTVTALSSSRVKRGTHAQATISVTAPGVAYPAGPIRIYNGSSLVKTVTLYTSQRGRVTTTLPLMTVGGHYIWASYLGNAYVAPSHSAKVKLVVYR